MKILVVREIKIFFLLFFSYINKNLSCDCCDECWEKFFPDKKPSSKYSDKNKKLDIPSIIGEEKEEEGNKIEAEENKDYLESLLEDISKVKILEGDFFTEKKDIYEIDKELGKGFLGVVYKIQKKKNGKFFALKQIDVIKHFNIGTSIQKEIKNMILLRNEKNIVKIFDVYKQERSSDTVFYIIMEFCENGDLDKLIVNKSFIKEKDELAYQIINAVYSCYKKNIVHRDLKPQNIFLDKDWNVKLGDFGLSDNFKYGRKESSESGTKHYMCYEKIKKFEHNPFKADLYSLGVILYELYTEISYSKGEHKPHSKSYKDDFYTNENVEHKLKYNLKGEKYNNLKILLTGLLKQLDVDRWGWEEILKSEFYKSLDKKYKE